MSSKPFGSPFDRPDADVILRSSDKVDFRVHKLILSIASPFFEQMFSLPEPSPASANDESLHDGLSLILMSESAATIELVLRFMYPIPSPKVTLEDIGALLEFTRKYDVHIYDFQVDCGLKDSIALDPVGVYALSVAYHLPDIGKLAAVAACRLPLDKLDSPLLHYLSVHQYRQLIAFRLHAGNALLDLLSGRSFYVETSGSFRHGYHHACTTCMITHDDKWVSHTIYVRYLRETRAAIEKGAGTDIILSVVDGFMPEDIKCCPGYYANANCSGLPKAAFLYFCRALHTAAQDTCSKIEFPTSIQ